MEVGSFGGVGGGRVSLQTRSCLFVADDKAFPIV